MSEEHAATGPRLIIALDVDNLQDCLNLAAKLDPAVCRLKVGKELFVACGPVVLERLQLLGFEVFLDLKFHDIPATVARAVRAAANAGVWMLNVHASGGREMMGAAVEALANCEKRPLLIGVTVLTSMAPQDLAELGVTDPLDEQVTRLALLAAEMALDGVVCSAHEAQTLKPLCGKSFKLVTPGIRPSWAQRDDQARVMTPEQAIAAGSDYLVLGRPVTRAENPAQVCRDIAQSLQV